MLWTDLTVEIYSVPIHKYLQYGLLNNVVYVFHCVRTHLSLVYIKTTLRMASYEVVNCNFSVLVDEWLLIS